MEIFTELWTGGPRFAQSEHFRLGTDSVLLADFVRLNGAKRGADLGCGSGILALLLLERSETLHMTGVEVLPEAAALAERNLAANGLSERCRVLCGDLRDKGSLPAGSFDLVVANPPYYPLGSGAISPKPGRDAARGELSCTLDELCGTAAWLCRTGGSFSLVYKPERLSELFCRLSAHGLEPKRLRMVCHRAESEPSLILVEARRGGKPGLRVEPALILCTPEGKETEEYRRIYHRS